MTAAPKLRRVSSRPPPRADDAAPALGPVAHPRPVELARGTARDRSVVAAAARITEALRGSDVAELERRLDALAPQLLDLHDRALARRDAALALEAIVALGPLMKRDGMAERLFDGIDAALRLGAHPPAVEARARQLLAVAATDRGRLDEAIASLDRAFALIDVADDPELAASLHNNRGLAKWMRGDDRAALRDFDAGIALDPPVPLAGKLHGNRGLACAHLGDVDGADRAYAEAIRRHRQAKNAPSEAIVLGQRANLFIRVGRADRAVATASRALRLLDGAGDARREGTAAGVLALAHQQLGRLDEAERLARRALDCHRRTGNANDESVARAVLADIARDRGAFAEAGAGYAEARELASEGVDRWVELICLVGLAVTHARLGDHPLAARTLADAEALAPSLDDPTAGALSSLTRAEVGRLAGALDDAAARAALADIARAHPDDARPAHLRLAFRSLEQCLGAPGHGVLELEPSMKHFSLDGGEPVSLARRALLKRLLGRLVDERRDHPGRPVSADVLREAGWPDERALPQAAQNRLHVAIATLRKLGLARILLTTDDGYLLDPAIEVRTR